MAAPSASPETVLSADEVADRIRQLSAPDQIRFIKASQYFSFGAARSPVDLRQEAIRRAISGTRKCPQHVPIITFLRGVMRSVAYSDRRAIGRASKLAVVSGDNAAGAGLCLDPRQSPEDLLIQEENVAELRQKILALFEDDPVGRLLAEGIMAEMEGKELQELVGLDGKDFATKRRLVRRRIDGAFPNGCKS